MIHVLYSQATDEQTGQMLEALDSYIRLAVDVERKVVAGGRALHADCEAALLEDGSNQENIWGADWLPFSREVTFESLINLRPGQGNCSMEVEDKELRARIREIVTGIFGQ